MSEVKTIDIHGIESLNDMYVVEIDDLLGRMKRKAVQRFEQHMYKEEVKYQAWSENFRGSILVNTLEISLELQLLDTKEKYASVTLNRDGSGKLKKNSKGVLSAYTNEFNEVVLEKHIQELMLLTTMDVFGDANYGK